MDVVPRLPVQPVRFLDRLRASMRVGGLSPATEKTYVYWTRQFIRHHGLQPPDVLDTSHIESYLSFLAEQRRVSTGTQQIALNALIFLFREFLERDTSDLSFRHARKHRR